LFVRWLGDGLDPKSPMARKINGVCTHGTRSEKKTVVCKQADVWSYTETKELHIVIKVLKGFEIYSQSVQRKAMLYTHTVYLNIKKIHGHFVC